MKKQFFFFAVSLCILSCKKEVKKVATVDKKEEITVDTISTEKKNLSDLHIFDLYSMENAGKYDTFISLSDIYNDSLAVPEELIQNQKTKTFAELKHFELTGIYREKLLKGTSLSETDTLFLYDYKNAKLEKFPIRDLKSVANLNLYTSEGEEISHYDYMIGFELNKPENSQQSVMYKSNYSLAYFGKENPFSGEKVVPIQWKKTSRDQFPFPLKNDKSLENTYLANFENLIYYIQDYKGEYGIYKRKLAVVQDNKVTFAKTFTRGEGAEFSPLNFINNNEYNDWQWTGKLFKAKPPVVFGFVSESFGCPSITFLDSSYPELYTDCDNRH
ncbi:hypothetical protein [Epilithonimonas xixisoli]|uniref:Uncharacterized protein n=1 Tax=Epilithonimonas xixisoli TaxID=1476462 RepID=A0A4R8IAQ0_9FLAO|nr:hypothetical protein [Epilithonimonas xixisoli]TDX87107.1 hypothetical protein B0I22_1287 [Epilithonimonas xixisoli]